MLLRSEGWIRFEKKMVEIRHFVFLLLWKIFDGERDLKVLLYVFVHKYNCSYCYGYPVILEILVLVFIYWQYVVTRLLAFYLQPTINNERKLL